MNKSMVVGITGGIGAGKSEVCAYFEANGLPVIRADDLAKDLANRDPIIKERLIAAFGPEVYHDSGWLNRQKLATVIFDDADALRTVNGIIHPRVFEVIDQQIALARKQHPGQPIFVEAALIYESGLDSRLDAVVVVHADQEKRIQRMQEGRAMSREDIERRIRAQMKDADRLDRTDLVIDNNGSRADLHANCRDLLGVLEAMVGEDEEAPGP